MRSFAGLYFFIRGLFFLYYPCKLYKIHFSLKSYLVLLFLFGSLLIAIARPYKESYMNVFDTLLLGHFAFICKVQTDDYFKGMGIQLFIVSLVPVFTLGICLIYIKVYKVYNFRCCRRRGPRIGQNNHMCQITTEDDIIVNSVLENSDGARGNETQPLLASIADLRKH